MSDAISDGYKLNRPDRRITHLSGLTLSYYKHELEKKHDRDPDSMTEFELAFLEMIRLYEAIHAPR